MSIFTLAFMGMVPFGSLLAGSAGTWLGVPHTIFISGILCLIGSLVFTSQLGTLREAARPVLIQKGILQASYEEAFIKE